MGDFFVSSCSDDFRFYTFTVPDYMPKDAVTLLLPKGGVRGERMNGRTLLATNVIAVTIVPGIKLRKKSSL